MSGKHEWKKAEKGLYCPKNTPEVIDVAEFKFLAIRGAGNPDEAIFSERIGALYALAYTIKMQLKQQTTKPAGYVDYTVYPLEGIWDITDEAKKTFTGTINKDDLVYQIMIRQPDFVSENYFAEMKTLAIKKKANPLLNDVEFVSFKEGLCIQMLHVGKFSEEPASFAKMEAFAKEKGFTRVSKLHREIYLSDMRKVAPEKLKTILRFNISQ